MEQWHGARSHLTLAKEDGGGFLFSHDIAAIVERRNVLLEPFSDLGLPVGREEMVQVCHCCECVL